MEFLNEIIPLEKSQKKAQTTFSPIKAGILQLIELGGSAERIEKQNYRY